MLVTASESQRALSPTPATAERRTSGCAEAGTRKRSGWPQSGLLFWCTARFQALRRSRYRAAIDAEGAHSMGQQEGLLNQNSLRAGE